MLLNRFQLIFWNGIEKQEAHIHDRAGPFLLTNGMFVEQSFIILVLVCHLNPSLVVTCFYFSFFSELKDSLSRMGSDLKQGFISSLKSAWQTLNEFARAHTSSTQLQAELEKVANQIKEEEEKQVVEGEWTHYWIVCNLVFSN